VAFLVGFLWAFMEELIVDLAQHRRGALTTLAILLLP